MKLMLLQVVGRVPSAGKSLQCPDAAVVDTGSFLIGLSRLGLCSPLSRPHLSADWAIVHGRYILSPRAYIRDTTRIRQSDCAPVSAWAAEGLVIADSSASDEKKTDDLRRQVVVTRYVPSAGAEDMSCSLQLLRGTRLTA